METDITSNEEDIVVLKEITTKLLKESPSSTCEEVAGSVFGIREHETRPCNLVIQYLIEPGAEITDKMERIMNKKENLQELLDVISAEVNVFVSARFVRRLGPIDENNSSHCPFLVGFDSENNCKDVLGKSSFLSE